MKLISATIKSFRRFDEAAINLDGNLIALIGPNEAGKSSLLVLLGALETNEPIAQGDIARGASPRPKDEVLTLRYLLDAQERRLAEGLVGEPRWYVYSKRFDGSSVHSVEPPVVRDLRYRDDALTSIRAFVNHRGAGALPPEDTPADSDPDPLTGALREVVAALEESNPDASRLADAGTTALKALSNESDLPAVEPSVAELHQSLTRLTREERRQNVAGAYLKELSDRRPRFLLFRQADRDLLGEYPNSALAAPPAALSNLFDLANLDATELDRALKAGDHGRREMLEELANQTLLEKFRGAWHQSSVYVRLSLGPDVVRILVRATDTYSPIAERSDGLRMFVALFSFVAPVEHSRPVVVLIDEAETHLHYDAQADLIRVFLAQDVASQIIYTTHSSGCLPQDLGTTIRVIQPQANPDGSDAGRSQIRNSPWSDTAGISPVLIAMGAAVAAFSPTRYAVFTEGTSDMILFPSLFREACGLTELPFQVVPGLASVGIERARDLGLEAPRVAYLLDGDEAGRQHASKLKRAGVSDHLVHRLPEGHVVEDYVAEAILIEALTEELRRSHGAQDFEFPALPAIGRCAAIEQIRSERGIAPPKRVKVAAQVVSHRNRGSILELVRRHELETIFQALRDALGLLRQDQAH